MHEVKIPDPKTQFEKTPAKIKIVRSYSRQEEQIVGYDEQTGKPIKETMTITEEVPEWVEWIEDEGEAARIVKWDEWKNRVLTAKDHTLTEMITEVRKRGGKEKANSKKGALAGIVELYKRTVSDSEYSSKTETDYETEVADFALRQGRWGLGCPAGCGRFWQFKPTDSLEDFEPEDPAAFYPFMDQAGRTYYGYLEWKPQIDGSVLFRCDNCGAEVKLTP